MAKTMKLDISDLNAQLAFFRKEMNSDFKKTWKNICNTKSYDKVTETFLTNIEKTGKPHFSKRQTYSKNILKYMKSH